MPVGTHGVWLPGFGGAEVISGFKKRQSGAPVVKFSVGLHPVILSINERSLN